MSRRKHHRRNLRTPPGSLTVEPGAPRPQLRFLGYGPGALVERQLASVAELKGLVGKQPVSWVNVDGLGDAAVLSELAALFHIHPLAMEDVVHTHQRAKLDEYPDHDFVVLRMLRLVGPAHDELESEQVGLFLGRDYVLTFQERPGGDSFEPVRERLRNQGSLLCSQGADALAHALLDAVVDDYFPVLEHYGERLEALEEEALELPTPATLGAVHATKRELLRVRRAVWPLREALATLARDRNPFVREQTRPYLRDLHDHTIQVMDLVESYRDLGSGLADLYLSSVSNRLNEIMKVLTIISTIFIPLSFIAGLYGMNFDRASPYNMPELGWRFGYLFCLALMAATAVGMLGYFVRKGWLGGPRPQSEAGAGSAPGPR